MPFFRNYLKCVNFELINFERMQVHTLKLNFTFAGREDALYPVLLHDGPEWVLVDCGYAGFLPLLEEAARQQGISLRELTGVIVTHHDADHVGGLAELKAAYPRAKVYASASEAGYVSGRFKSLRLQQAEDLYPSLPEAQQPGALAFQQMLRQVRPVPVDHVFTGDEAPAFMPGIRIVPTPGHTPGHISVYVPSRKLLVAADALVYEAGAFEIANPQFTLDLPVAVASVRKLRELALDTVVCYHGGEAEGDIAGKLERLLAKYGG
jgi:glyoxylase-like metal-dependent hydrolase (beta-lactamase superfamily II)